MINITKVELELISDTNMYLFFEKWMTGGISYITKRYSRGSNKHSKYNDPKQESKHILYLDAKKLYYSAMPKFLPKSEFKLTDPKDFMIQINTAAIVRPVVF